MFLTFKHKIQNQELLNPPPLTAKDKPTPQVDLSPLLIPNQSDLFNRDITGKVNPDGNTLGKTVSTVTGAVIPIVIGGVVKPVSPQTSKSFGALPEIEIVRVN